MQMSNDNKSIEDYFEDSDRPFTPYSEPLKFIFSNLIREYFLEKNMLKRFNSNRANYNRLAIKISNEYEITDKIDGSYLKNLCFPEREQERSRDKLKHIYDYLDRFLASKNRVAGQYWLLKSESKKIEIEHGKSTPKLPLQGAIYIDPEFFENIKAENASTTTREFYLSKLEPYCQWYGIMEDWDYPRGQFEFLGQIALNAFKGENAESVIAVVTGDSGNGKSTLLRRLAFTLKEADFHTIWINNLKDFYPILKQLKNNG